MRHAKRVLDILGEQEMSGRELRARLNHGRWCWQRWSGPAFWLLMWELEVSLPPVVFTTSRLKQNGIRERYYRATAPYTNEE